MKSFLLFLFLFFASFSYSQVDIIASVGNDYITKKDLTDYKKLYELDSISDIEVLQKIIQERLLLGYAKQNSVSISDEELDAFFEAKFFSHPLVSENGVFSRTKYLAIKQTPKIQNALKIMSKELLLNKIKTILLEELELDEDELLASYVANNTTFDITYYIIGQDEAHSDTIPTEKEIKKFYSENKYLFSDIKRVKFEYTTIFDDDVEGEFDIDHFQIPDSLKDDYFHDLARQKATDIRLQWEAGIPPITPLFQTPYLDFDKKFANLPKKTQIYNRLFEGLIFPLPIELPDGYLILKLVDYKYYKIDDEDGDLKQIWRTFISEKRGETQSNPISTYYSTNLFDLVTKAAKIKLTEYPIKSLKIPQIAEFRTGLVPKGLEGIGKESNRLVILAKYNNNNDLLDEIAVKIMTSQITSGIVAYNKSFYSYEVVGNFPSYLPAYSQVKTYLYQTLSDGAENELILDAEDYYARNSYKFRIPMSVSFTGLFFPFDDYDTTQITEKQVDSFYLTNSDIFQKHNKYDFDYIYIEDEQGNNLFLPHYVKAQVKSGVDFDYLKRLFSDSLALNRDVFASPKLPQKIKSILDRTEVNKTSEIFYFAKGWLFLIKKSELGQGAFTVGEARQYIQKKLSFDKAKEFSKKEASEMFRKVNSYSTLKKLTDSSNYFVTSHKQLNQEFELLGNIGNMENELVRFYNRWKYPTLFENELGFAVLFIEKINHSRVPKLDEIEHLVEIRMQTERKEQTSRKFVSSVSSAIANDFKNVQKVIPYFADEFNIVDFKIGDQLPALSAIESTNLFETIIGFDEGSVSKPILLSSKKYLIFNLVKKDVAKVSKFKKIKQEYAKEIQEKEFEKWIENYRNKIGVKLYQ